MGNKENILEILKKHKDGLTIPDLDIEYEKEHGRRFGHALYSYLHRLTDKDLIEPFIPKMRMGNVIGYKATEIAYEEERKEEAFDNLVLLMVKAGVNSEKLGIDITEEQIEPSIKRLTESGKLG